MAKSENILVRHARRELKRAGLFDSDSDYNGLIGNAVMELIKAFSKQGHSGYSAGTVAQIFISLVAFETLTPITDDPNEWNKIDLEMNGDINQWQCARNPALFSEDGGKTYIDISSEEKGISINHKEINHGTSKE